MKIYVSYFYQLRFFPQYAIPLSTAAWDPKWFHDFKGHSHVFIDKRGVLNGLRFDNLILEDSRWSQLENNNQECQKDCPHPKDGSCAFMKTYREQLDEKYPQITGFFQELEEISQHYKKEFPAVKEEPIIILLVHEKPTIPCSERVVLQRWFRDNGYELPEWSKEE